MGPLRASVAVLVAFAAACALAPAASACSLAYQPPRDRVEHADAAVYAQVVGAQEVGRDAYGFARYRYTLRVLETFKGSAGELVEVEGGDNDAMCELGRLGVGERYGLLLHGSPDPWRAVLADRISRDELVAATARYPSASGRGTAALLVGGPFGSADVLALDARGQVLAYGFGSGAPQSVCPGSRRFVARRAVVRMTDLRPVSRRSSPGWSAARCLDRLGRRVVGFTSARAGGGRSRLVLAVGARRRVRDVGRASEAVLGRRSALLLTRGRVVRVGYASGRRRFVARLPRSSRSLAVSPGGRRLAVLEGSRIVVADRVSGRGLTRVVGAADGLVWLGRDRIAVLGSGGSPTRVLDASLRLVATTPGSSSRAAARGDGVLWSLSGDGHVLAAQPGGDARPVCLLPPDTRGPLLVVPGASEVEASQRTPA